MEFSGLGLIVGIIIRKFAEIRAVNGVSVKAAVYRIAILDLSLTEGGYRLSQRLAAQLTYISVTGQAVGINRQADKMPLYLCSVCNISLTVTVKIREILYMRSA